VLHSCAYEGASGSERIEARGACRRGAYLALQLLCTSDRAYLATSEDDQVMCGVMSRAMSP
jgi:hypothetical protein